MLHFLSIADNYEYRKQLSFAPEDYKQACSLLKNVRQKNEKVIANISITGIDDASFKIDASLPSSNLLQPQLSSMQVYGNYQVFNQNALVAMISNTSTRYIFVQANLPLDSLLQQQSVQQQLWKAHIKLDTLYNSSGFNLIKVVRSNR